MTAVARPCWDNDSQTFFYGKNSICPFIKDKTSKRNSKNRLKGSIVTKPVTSVGKDAVNASVQKKIRFYRFDRTMQNHINMLTIQILTKSAKKMDRIL